MPEPHTPQPTAPLDALAEELAAVVRRHDPAWTGFTSHDPGITLLEVGAWMTERLGGTAARSDPYRNFNFRLKIDGSVVAGVSRVSALRRSTDVIEHREGGAPGTVQRLPGRLSYSPFLLERPLGADTTFEDWADLVRDRAAGSAAADGYRKNVRIEILDHAGRLSLAYDVPGCWPIAYRVLPDLTEGLTLAPEAWQRDRSVG
jgi:phage tail-like protein